MSNRAIFLDRDGTMIEDPGYLSSPDQIKLLPGVELAIKSLRQAGYEIIVVTNQSAIARGMIDEEQLERIHERLREKLSDKGAEIDAIYYCPYHPEGTVSRYAKESELRKPAPGMLLKAAGERGIDLAGSWMIGDGARDVGAGQRAGCRTIRIQHPDVSRAELHHDEQEEFQADATVRNLVEAARVILRDTQPAPGSATEPAGRESAPAPKLPAAEDVPPSRPERPASPPKVASPAPEPEAEDVAGSSDPEPEPQPTGGVSIYDDSTVRREILQYVRQISRQAESEEFSLAHVVGGIAQMIALMFLVLTFIQAIGKADRQMAIVWGLVAVFFQTMSLTFFVMVRKK